MRLRIKIQIVALLFISMLALFACSKDENDEPTKPPQPEPKDEKNMLSEKARVITQDKAKTAQVVFNEATQKLTVKNSSELSKPIKQGDIIVSGENGGYLRKVIAITKNGNEVIASTEQATLEEAFKNLDLTLNVPIEPKSTKAQEQGLYEAVYYDAEVVPGKPMAFTVQPNILTKGGNSRLMERKFKIALDKDSLIYAKGKIKIAPTLKGNIKIEKLKLKKLNLGFEIEENISLEYYAGKKFSTNKIIKDKKLAHWAYKDIIVVVGGVPIAIRPVLDFYVGFEASSEAKVNMKAEQKYSYTTGYLYENNKWDRYHNEKKSASLKPPTIEGKAKAKAYIKPVLALEFYRIVAPNIEVETGIEAKIKAAASPINGFSWDWSIGAYLEANMGVAVKVLGKSITNAKFADPILELNFPIASAKDYKGNRAPETPTLTSPKNDTTTEKQTVSFTWQCKDYNKDALIYTLFYTTEKNGAIYSNWKKKENISATTYQLDNLGYGTYYWKVLAKESKTKDKLQAESPVYSFTISKANNAPTKPELTKPANNKTVEAKKILLEWKASSDADNDKISYTIFMSEANIMNITRQASINIVLAAGMTFVILTGGIDLSVGSILGVTAVVSLVTSLNPAVAAFSVPIALIAGLFMGVFNGALVAYAGLPPFIVTLGTFTSLRGAAYLFADGTTVINSNIGFAWIGNNYLGPVPWLVIIAFVTIAVCWFILRRTTLGTHIYAVGGNLEAARLTGIKVYFVLIFA